MYLDKLEDLIKKNDGYVTTKEVTHNNIPREYLSLLVKKGKIERVSSGVYQTLDAWDDFLFEYQQRKSKLIYSHGTALFLHGISDRDPIKYEATVPTGFNVTQLKNERVKLYTIKDELFELGKTILKTNAGNDIFCYDMERSICDMIRSRNKLDISLVMDSLKIYIRKKDRDLLKLHDYARKLRVDKLLRTYLEVLL